MSSEYQSVQHAALQLSLEERELLAERLMLSLHNSVDAHIEESWFAAAEERYQLYKAGSAQVFEVNDVIESLRKKIQ
jgi:hypothetical protein